MKTSKLNGPALDWAVAKCENISLVIQNNQYLQKGWQGVELLEYLPYHPSSDWAQGGPIIERGNIDLISPTPSDPLWQAMQWRFSHGAKGPTPLIAAMRCYVASRLGNEVQLPKELE